MQQTNGSLLRSPWVLALFVLLGLRLLVVAAGDVYDRRWEGRLEAKLEQLRREGLYVPHEEVLDRHTRIPPGQNAALGMRVACDRLVKTPEGELAEQLHSSASPASRPSDETVDFIRSELEANAEALELARDALSLGEGSYPLTPNPMPFAILLDHLSPLQDVARLFARKAWVRAASADGEGAARSVLACRGVGRTLGTEHVYLIEELVRIAIGAITVDGLERSLALTEMPPESLRGLRNALAEEAEELSIVWPLKTELTGMHGTIEYMMRTRAGFDILDGGSFIWQIYPLVPGWREKDELLLLSFMARTARAADLPPRERLDTTRAIGRELEREMTENRTRYPLFAMLTPALTRVFEAVTEAEARLLTARAALAVEEWRMAHGRWPESLQDLAPEVVEEAPIDRLSEEPFEYQHTEEGVLLYSVGADGRDDGGISADEAREAQDDPHRRVERYDIPFRLLDPELRGAKQRTFRDEVLNSDVTMRDLTSAGLDEEKLRELGFTEEDLRKLR